MMKFITEEYLRDLYRKEPFITYKLNEGQRLTPGARQYLSDKGIKMQDDILKVNNKASEVKQSIDLPKESKNLKNKLCGKLKSIEVLFLVIGSEILNKDIILSQNVIELGKKVSNIRNVIKGKGTLDSVFCNECTGITLANFYEEMDDCFEITEFYMHLESSNEIFKLHLLRCNLREIGYEIFEVYTDNDEEMGNKIIRNVNSIVNSLSQMICSTVGGMKCQKER